jgi:hypothetical protein
MPDSLLSRTSEEVEVPVNYQPPLKGRLLASMRLIAHRRHKTNNQNNLDEDA